MKKNRLGRALLSLALVLALLSGYLVPVSAASDGWERRSFAQAEDSAATEIPGSAGSDEQQTAHGADEVVRVSILLERVSKSDTVVTIAVGNAGHWAQYAKNGVTNALYAGDVGTDTTGQPGSFRNSLGVASVDNTGSTGDYIEVAGQKMVYAEPGHRNYKLTTLAGEQEYIFLDGFGSEEEFAAIADVLAGKIAICSRGGMISFSEKADAAVKYGAIATIIYNNEPGINNMNLLDYKNRQPCVSILQSDGAAIRAASAPVTDADGKVLYLEIMNVCADCPSKAYSDLNTNSWYHEYTDYVIANGLMQGWGQKFVPAGSANRAMMVQVLYNLAGCPDAGTDSGFVDVSADSWYARAVTWARSAGIVNGVDSEHFSPRRAVTRQEAVTMLYRYAKEYAKIDMVPGADLTSFSDQSRISPFARPAMEWAVAAGLVQGMKNGTIAPRDTLNRVQLAALFTRLDQNILK